MNYAVHNNKKNGFTLLEVLLVVALIGITTLLGTAMSSGSLWRTELQTAHYASVVTLRRAQMLARAQAYDSDWGVSIVDNEMTLFKGDSFVARDTLYDEVVTLRSVTVLAPVEVVYHKFSGKPYQSFSEIQLMTNSDTAILTINAEGTISY